MGVAGRDLAWPSIATDGDGKLWVNYARAGGNQCLAAYAGVVQPGATGAASVLIHGGDGRFEYDSGLERWGDYTAISRDPAGSDGDGGLRPISDRRRGGGNHDRISGSR